MSTLGFPGNNSRPEFQASGAYFFRPLTPTPQPVSSIRNMFVHIEANTSFEMEDASMPILVLEHALTPISYKRP